MDNLVQLTLPGSSDSELPLPTTYLDPSVLRERVDVLLRVLVDYNLLPPDYNSWDRLPAGVRDAAGPQVFGV